MNVFSLLSMKGINITSNLDVYFVDVGRVSARVPYVNFFNSKQGIIIIFWTLI